MTFCNVFLKKASVELELGSTSYSNSVWFLKFLHNYALNLFVSKYTPKELHLSVINSLDIKREVLQTLRLIIMYVCSRYEFL